MTPNFRIDLGGSDRTTTLRPYLNSIKVRDQDGSELDTATVTLKYDNRIEIPQRGTDIEIFLGYKGENLFSVFKGVVGGVGVNGPPDKLFLKATGLPLSDEKRLQGSTTRSWNEKTLGEIASEVIQGAGFKARVHDRLSSIELKRYMQTLETDIELLQKLAEAFGGFLKSDGETVAILPVRSRESASGETLPQVTIRKEKSTEFGWTEEYRKFAGTILSFYQDDGETRAITKGSGNPTRKLKQIYATQAEAEAAATQEVERYETQDTFSVNLPGQDIAVGVPLQVQGFPVPIVGVYWVRSVAHSYNKNAYTVSVEADR